MGEYKNFVPDFMENRTVTAPPYMIYATRGEPECFKLEDWARGRDIF